MSITDKSRNQNVIVSEYESKEDLIQVCCPLLCTNWARHKTTLQPLCRGAFQNKSENQSSNLDTHPRKDACILSGTDHN